MSDLDVFPPSGVLEAASQKRILDEQFTFTEKQPAVFTERSFKQ